jgi:hypothetical protein
MTWFIEGKKESHLLVNMETMTENKETSALDSDSTSDDQRRGIAMEPKMQIE